MYEETSGASSADSEGSRRREDRRISVAYVWIRERAITIVVGNVA